MYDTVLKNGTVFDGVDDEGRKCDIGIKAGRIAAIGQLSEEDAGQLIDCTGLCLLPGFIDTHTHSDMFLLNNRLHSRASLQGVTTEIVSPCGLGLYPLSHDKLKEFSAYLRGLLGPASENLDFSDTAGYLKAVGGRSVNVAAQVSHGALRMESKGFVNTPVTEDDYRKMEYLMDQAAEQGCVAFTTGLSYYPASYAFDDEVIRLCRHADKLDLPLAVHCRTIFPDNRYDMHSRYQEFLDIGKESGCHVHFSHTKPTYATAHSHPQKFLDPFEKAMSEGMRVTMEMYPYPSGAGFAVIFLPGWVLEGGTSQALHRIRNPRIRRQIEDELEPNEEKISWGIIGHLEKHVEYLGKTIGQLAYERKESARSTLLWLLSEENLGVGYQSNTPTEPALLERYESMYAYSFAKPYYTIGSDSEPGQAFVHPRTSGTFVKMYRLAREAGISPAVFAKRVSANGARIFGLKDRGTLRAGSFADIVVLKHDQVHENCTFHEPDKAPSGIVHVFVNGVMTVKDAQMTGEAPGIGLERKR